MTAIRKRGTGTRRSRESILTLLGLVAFGIMFIAVGISTDAPVPSRLLMGAFGLLIILLAASTHQLFHGGGGTWSIPTTVALVLSTYGLMALIVSVVPPISLLILTGSAAVTLLAMPACLAYRRTGNWAGRVYCAMLFPFLLMMAALRAWNAILGWRPVFFTAIVLITALAWSLPVVAPSISKLLYRAGMDPSTRVGSRLQKYVILPTFLLLLAAELWAVISKNEMLRATPDLAGVALLGTVVAIFVGHLISHQMWIQRPWA